MNSIGKAFFGLHLSTFISAVLGILLSFKSPMFAVLPLITSTLLHGFLIHLEFKKPAPNGQKLVNRLLMNYSAHVIAMNILFFFTFSGGFMWTMALGFASFYQVLAFAVGQIFPRMQQNKLTQKLTALYGKITNPPMAPQLLATMEIMSMMMPTRVKSGLVKFLVMQAYLFGFVLYRYAVDPTHKFIWSQWRMQINQLTMKLPAVIGNLIQKLLNNMSTFGTIAGKIYQVRT